MSNVLSVKRHWDALRNYEPKFGIQGAFLGAGQYVESIIEIFSAQLKNPLVLQHVKPPPCEFSF